MAWIYNTSEAVITVAFEEIDNSPQESITAEGLVASRLLRCDWGDRFQLARELLGYSKDTGFTVTSYRPHRYPAASHLFAQNISISGAGASGGSAAGDAAGNYNMTWAKADLSVEYLPRTVDDADPRTMVSESVEPNAEFLTLPSKLLYWDAAAKEPLGADEAPGLVVRMMNWVVTHHNVRSLHADFWELIGHVNDAAVESKTFGFTLAAETLLYQAPSLSREITTDGAQAWRVTVRFSYRPDGWNLFFKAGSTTPVAVYDKNGTQQYPYTRSDFTNLVRALP